MRYTAQARPGSLYRYQLDGDLRVPDPASRYQPEDVHGVSEVIDPSAFRWRDEDWQGRPWEETVLYELHVGTFTPEGTFAAARARLDYLVDLGVTAVELMPVADFPGSRNWGYDGAYLYAVQNSYGGPQGLKTLVNACHLKGMAVILDVVYNHLGPEGNYLMDFGPYFTDKYRTPWGTAFNLDDAYSNEVREFFIQNALHWFRDYHLDALRIDAVHGLTDFSATPMLQELAERVDDFSSRTGNRCSLIAESDLNDARVIRQRELGGYGIHAQWCDDFHHALHTLLTGEDRGYYRDFGRTEHLVKSLREGFVYTGEYSVFRRRNHGNSSKDRPAKQFVVFSQNHDHVGNRMLGERLSRQVSFEALKLAAGTVLFSPYIPLIFMGEEYGEDAPFLYFVSHSDRKLIEAVRKGRAEEFSSFGWKEDPPDPQSEMTFTRSKVNWEKRTEGSHAVLTGFYAHLIRLRKELPALSRLDKNTVDVWGMEPEKLVIMRRWSEADQVCVLFNFNAVDGEVEFPGPDGVWRLLLDSADTVWNGPGTALPDHVRLGDRMTVRGKSCALFVKEEQR